MRTLALLCLLAGCGAAPAEPSPAEPAARADAEPGRDPLTAAREAFADGRCELPRGSDGATTRGPLIYAESGSKRLHLDLTRPEGEGPHPVAALFHGGGFHGGDEDHLAGLARDLAAAGWAAARIEYRLAGREHPDFPAPVSPLTTQNPGVHSTATCEAKTKSRNTKRAKWLCVIPPTTTCGEGFGSSHTARGGRW